MSFLVGCNYWSGKSGIRMWNEYDEKEISEELDILAQHGVRYLRVFPVWSEFQPVSPLFGAGAVIREYRMANGTKPADPWYLDEEMLEKFHSFCRLASERSLRLIVGLLTGWMSGRCFIPPALYGKDLYCDPTALLFEQKYIEGMVHSLKDEPAICAWDIGNECNCMYNAGDQYAAESWTMTITNAIRAGDPSRPVVSGMHGLRPEGTWTIEAQAAHTDVLTTHPYPCFVEHCDRDGIDSFRAFLHGTCETRLYSDIGGKPCLVEELGTLGPNKCDDQTAALFLRANLYSNWVHGAEGVLWWCANDFTERTDPPYSWNMYERELGLLDKNRQPKPMLRELKAFSDWLEHSSIALPPAETDGVCILSKGQDQWGIGYMSYLLAKQAKINLRFCYAEDGIPESRVYLLPCTEGDSGIPLENMRLLEERVRNGATLYISSDNSVLADFSELCGVTVRDLSLQAEVGTFQLNGQKLWYQRSFKRTLRITGAKVLAETVDGQPLFVQNRFGKGNVFFLNAPFEKNLLDKSDAFSHNQHEVYRVVFGEQISEHKVDSRVINIGITRHIDDTFDYAVILNYSTSVVDPALEKSDGRWELLYGNDSILEPAGMAILRCRRAKEEEKQ